MPSKQLYLSFYTHRYPFESEGDDEKPEDFKRLCYVTSDGIFHYNNNRINIKDKQNTLELICLLLTCMVDENEMDDEHEFKTQYYMRINESNKPPATKLKTSKMLQPIKCFDNARDMNKLMVWKTNLFIKNTQVTPCD